MKNKAILIIGNGPSTRLLAEFGFHNISPEIDTFGMGAAYRYFYCINWWPTYFACCDAKVVHSHRKNFSFLLEDKDVSTRKFYFSLPLSKDPRLEVVPHSSTGDFCFNKAIELGYEKIYLIGTGGNYVEEVEGSRALRDDEISAVFSDVASIPNKFLTDVRIIEHNRRHSENYFFPWYQQKGDIYSLPKGAIHQAKWERASAETKASVVKLADTGSLAPLGGRARDASEVETQRSASLEVIARKSRIVVIALPTLRTEQEYRFWNMFCDEICQRGYRPVIVSVYTGNASRNIVAEFNNQLFFHFSPGRMALLRSRDDMAVNGDPETNHIAGYFAARTHFRTNYKANLKEVKSIHQAVGRISSSVKQIVEAFNPCMIVCNNDTAPESLLFEHFSRKQKIQCLFSERSPTITQWFEPRGFYQHAVALESPDTRFLEDPEFDLVGEITLAQLAANPAMHRNTAAELGAHATTNDNHAAQAQARFGEKRVFLLAMDAVLNTGWVPTGHRLRPANYPLFETPFDAIRTLKAVAEKAGAELWIKPHPSDPVFNSEDTFHGVSVFRGSIGEALSKAEIVFGFLTKVVFAALAQRKRTVLLSPTIARLCPAAHYCDSVDNIERTVQKALAHDWTEADTRAVRRFLGWLYRDYFVANDLSNPGSERLFDTYFPTLPAELEEPDIGRMEESAAEIPGMIVPRRPAAAPREPACLLGPFERDHDMRLEEVDVVQRMFASQTLPVTRAGTGVMLDVGACKGGAFDAFAKMGWEVHAFEPNPPMHAYIHARLGNYTNVALNQLAVSDKSDQILPFYTSDESIGISSLSPFRDTHKPTAEVRTVRLDTYCRMNSISHVDFLKIDTEGFDLFVLKGVDWDRLKPSVIICEYEDSKTEKLGYTTEDMATYLRERGYTVFASEWHPIISYGGATHCWRSFKHWASGVVWTESWGNLIAFRDPISEETVAGYAHLSLEDMRITRLKREMSKRQARKAKAAISQPQVAASATAKPVPSVQPASDAPPDLTARLLLDPAATLPQLDPGGPLHQAAEALIAQGGPEAEHFARVRDWARRRAA